MTISLPVSQQTGNGHSEERISTFQTTMSNPNTDPISRRPALHVKGMSEATWRGTRSAQTFSSHDGLGLDKISSLRSQAQSTRVGLLASLLSASWFVGELSSYRYTLLVLY